jgi:hypothetical protein
VSGYEVHFTPRATAAFDETFEWYRRRSSVAAEKWIAAVELALDRVEDDPLRYPRATDQTQLPITLRQYSFGAGRRLTHRMVFGIREMVVVVYAIRHLSQDALTIDDLLG